MIPLQTSIEKKDFSERAHKGSQGDPKGAKEGPGAPQGAPKKTKGRTKEGQKEANGVPEGPKGVPWHPKRSSKENYINKNSRSSGLYVINKNELMKSYESL